MADGGDELSAADRRFIRQQRVFMVLNNFCWAIQRPGSDQAYMDLCGGDSALMARHYGGVQSMNNFFNMFLNRESPSIGLSPRYRLTCIQRSWARSPTPSGAANCSRSGALAGRRGSCSSAASALWASAGSARSMPTT